MSMDVQKKLKRTLNFRALSFPIFFLILTTYVEAEDYYWDAHNEGNWIGNSPKEVCDIIVSDMSTFLGKPKVIEILRQAYIGRADIFYCKIRDVELGSGGYPKGELGYYMNLRGSDCTVGKFNPDNGACDKVIPSRGKNCPQAGDPVAILTGTMFEKEHDYKGGTHFPLVFKRHYDSSVGVWLHNYQTRFLALNSGSKYLVQFFDGKVWEFTLLNSSWVSATDTSVSLTQVFEQGESLWKFKDASGKSYLFNSYGQLVKIRNQEGREHAVDYQGGLNPVIISDDSGRQITLQYSGDLLSKMTDPDGNQTNYYYSPNEYLIHHQNLIKVEGSSSHREYRYDNADFPNKLTSIIDENSNLISSWEYDSAGRALFSERLTGIERTEFDYTYIDDVNNPRVTVTNELGKQTTYHYTTIHGVRKVTQVEGHATANCAAANQSYTYDGNGFKDEVIDWEGNKTDYDYDARGLEVQRVEAKGTAQERTITTEWHTDFRLPTKITEPDRVIEFSYDTQGLLLERKETPMP